MKRKPIISLGLGLLLASCSGLPTPIRDDAEGKKLVRLTNQASADPLTDQVADEVLFAANSRSRDPLMGGEDLVLMHDNLVLLRQRLGDEKFAAALNRANPAVVSAVGWHLHSEASSTEFPLSSAVLAHTPKRVLELENSYARQ